MTEQIREKCIYLGEVYDLPFCIPFPQNDNRIKQLSYEEISDVDRESLIFSTACWREYIGTWEIQDGRLYLSKLEGKYRLLDDESIFANWFSGEMRIPHGDLVDCNIEAGFELKYEQELCLKLHCGVVIESKLIDSE